MKHGRNRLQVDRRAKRTWLLLVVALLGLQLTIGGIAIALATSDPSAVVVPNYHQSALDWDSEQASRRLIDELGWTFEMELSEAAGGDRWLHVHVQDVVGDPVDGLRIGLAAFHHARARNVIETQLDSIGKGRYQVLVPMSKAGHWELDFEIRLADRIARVKRTTEVR
ncbi:MAG: FixH family protein [Planctomycetota bacterium]